MWHQLMWYMLGKMHQQAADLEPLMEVGKFRISAFDLSSQSWLSLPVKSCKFFVFRMPLGELFSVFSVTRRTISFCLFKRGFHRLYLMASHFYIGRDSEQSLSLQALQTTHDFIDS